MNIFEIQKSINGEINQWHQGSPAIFIRFAGCNLHNAPCSFCDTKKALMPNSGMELSFSKIKEILEPERRTNVIVLTGGEPLWYMKSVLALLGILSKMGFQKVVIETNGTINPIEIIKEYPAVNIVMDYKLPSSGNFHLMQVETFQQLRMSDFVKFPILNKTDLEIAIEIKELLSGTMVISPIFNEKGEIFWSTDKLIKQVRDNNFILSIQIHKILKCY